MSIALAGNKKRRALRSRSSRLSFSIADAVPLLIIFAVAAALRLMIDANTDVSWAITMAEKILDGQRLYIDVIEVNPPATVFLYTLPVLLARAVSIRPEVIVETSIFLATAASLWCSAQILVTAGFRNRANIWPLAALAAAVLLILPARTFGEREHIALIVFLPFLALMMARAKKISPQWLWVVASGVAAGIVIVIKPHFLFAVVFVALAAAWSVRSWKPLFAPEMFIAAILGALYAIGVGIYFPVFFSDIVPLAAVVYLPVKMPFWKLIGFFATPIWIMILIVSAMLKERAIFSRPYSLLLAGSCGFAVSFYLQQKGWSYHSYPALALAVLAVVIAFSDRWNSIRIKRETPQNRFARLGMTAVVAFLSAISFCWLYFAVDMRALAEPIRKIKPRPKIIAITSDIGVGHPLARDVGGTWVGRVGSLWITTGVLIRKKHEKLDPDVEARLTALADRDRVMLAQDIERNRPDIILVERANFAGFDWKAWAEADPAINRQLKSYREVETIGPITILSRETNPRIR
jgi:hypothetical protein